MSTKSTRENGAEAEGISRRTIVKGVAWATPVIAVATVVPEASASLPPCVGSVSGVSQGSWSVGARFPGCTQNSHFDVSVQISIKACEAQSICIRVYDLGDENNGSGLRSRLWWDYTSDQTPPYLFIEKCITVPAEGTVPVSFAIQNDTVRRETTQFAESSTVVGTIGAVGGTNDGIHVNPCYFGGAGSSGRVAKFYYRLGNAGAWLPGGYINANRPA